MISFVDLQKLIPGGSHTYSKGADQLLGNKVPVAVKSQGCHIFDVNNNKYLDWQMGNRVICLSHADRDINKAVLNELNKGCNHSFPSKLEYDAANYFVNELKLGEMVKFGKNGSDAISASIRLSRAYTSKKKILICSDQPFYSIHDWFIGSTSSYLGTDEELQKNVLKFKWNSIESLQQQIDENEGQIACLLLEILKFERPSLAFINYLNNLKNKHKILLVADENINCMKFGIKGAYDYFNVKADLICYGKAIANGYSFSMLSGKREIMNLGGINEKEPKVFLLSQTHSSESSGIAAALATCKKYQKKNVESHIKKIGKLFKDTLNKTLLESEIGKYLSVGGLDQNPNWEIRNLSMIEGSQLRAWLISQFLDYGIVISWITICFSHKKRHVFFTNKILKKIIESSKSKPWKSIKIEDLPKPVFRKYQFSLCNNKKCTAKNSPRDCIYCSKILSYQK